MQKLINGVWVDCTQGDLVGGDTYRIGIGGTGWQQQTYQEPPVATPILTIGSVTVTDSAGGGVLESSGKYYVTIGFTPAVTLQLSDTGVNAPLIKLPFVKYADDAPTPIELYLTGNIVNGLMTVQGEAVTSGNYKVTSERTNRALDRMGGSGAGFHVSFADIDFLV